MSQHFPMMLGKKVLAIRASEACVSFELDDGFTCEVSLEGDCCSYSYFTDPKSFEELVGDVLLDIEDRQEKPPGNYPSESDDGNTSILWSFLHIKTNKSHYVFDWRNDSNGYYSGYITTRRYQTLKES